MTSRIVYGRINQYFLDGKQVSEAVYRASVESKIQEVLETGQIARGHHSAGWPMVSDAMAVHPDQIGEAFQRARNAGVRTDFTREGQPIFTSQNHRKEYCQKVEGRVIDRNAGYGDPS